MWGIPAFCHTFPEECGGISRGFVLIQDGGESPAIILARTSGYISVHWSGHKCSQVFIESILLLFKSIH